MEQQTKCCTKCGETKPMEGFSASKRNPDGKQYACKACNAAISAEWRRNNPDKGRVYTSRWAKSPKGKAYRSAYQLSPAGKAARARRNVKRRENLGVSYIKHLLTDRTNVSYRQLPKSLIDLKKLHMLIKRELKNEQHY